MYFSRVSMHDVVGKLRARIGLVPPGRLAVVADVLLVEAVLCAAGLVRVAGPEAGGVGGQRLVAEDEIARGVQTELELRVGDDDPGREGVLGGGAVEEKRDLLDAPEQVVPDELGGLVARDVLVVTARRLRRRREDRLGKLLRLLQTLRQPVPADLARRLVVLPARARDVAAHDALDRQHLEPPTLHRPAVLADREHVVRRRSARGARTSNRYSPVRTRPLSGISVGRTTSKVEIRSLATSRSFPRQSRRSRESFRTRRAGAQAWAGSPFRASRRAKDGVEMAGVDGEVEDRVEIDM